MKINCTYSFLLLTVYTTNTQLRTKLDTALHSTLYTTHYLFTTHHHRQSKLFFELERTCAAELAILADKESIKYEYTLLEVCLMVVYIAYLCNGTYSIVFSF